jgi:integrase
MKLTPKTVEHLRPHARRVEIPDAQCAGLYLILQPSGHRSWAARYRANGKPVKLTLGSFPKLTLHDAREAAAAALKQVKLGNDPAKARQDAKIKADAAKADTVTAVCEKYLTFEGRKLRTVDQRISTLRRLVYPTIGERPIREVKRSEITTMLDKVEHKSGPRMADVCLATLRRIFHWHETRSDDWRSPIIRGMANRQNTVEHRRSRVLDDNEIRRVWQATEDDTAFSALIRFLLLTSARRSEGAAMRWDEVDANGIWVLPSARSKTKVEVVRPLSKAAQAILAELPHIGDHPFTSNAITPINNFSDPKKALDARSGVRDWRLHDLRRTARSLMSRAHVDRDIAERILGHSRGDLLERYDQHFPLDQMRDAVERLAAQIERIVNPPPSGKVADMAAERKRRRR